jgi:PEP-CTERM motif-containing protein
LPSIDFYSDGTGGFDSPADRLPPLPIDLPGSFNAIRILEIGGEAFYQTDESGIGGLRGFDTFYHFISDGRIPEPASLLLLVSGFVGLAGMEWRRHRRK